MFVLSDEPYNSKKMYEWQKRKLQDGEWMKIDDVPTADQLFDAMPRGTKALHIRLRDGERTGYCHICLSTGKPVQRREKDPNGWMYPDDNMPETGRRTLRDKYCTMLQHFAAPKKITRHWCKNIVRHIRKVHRLAMGGGDQPWEIERRYHWPLCMKGSDY